MRRFLIVLFVFALFVAPNAVLASGFNLQSIGGVDTSGLQISHWWYTGYRPTFRGEAVSSAPVNVTIDGTAVQIAADSAGSWVYTPEGQLADGDHTVALESNGSTINFKLTLGPNNVDMAAVEKGSGGALPASGTFEVTLVLGLTSIAMMGFGARLLRLW